MSANDTIWAGWGGYLDADPRPGNCFTVGISEADPRSETPWFHPTLTNEVIHLRDGMLGRSFEVFSFDGRLLQRAGVSGNVIHVGWLSPGNYVLRMEDSHGLVRLGRFMKE